LGTDHEPRSLVNGGVHGRQADGSGIAAAATEPAGTAIADLCTRAVAALAARAGIGLDIGGDANTGCLLTAGRLEGNHAAVAALAGGRARLAGRSRIVSVATIAASGQQGRVHVD